MVFGELVVMVALGLLLVCSMYAGGGGQGDGKREGCPEKLGQDAAVEEGGAAPQGGGHSQRAQSSDCRVFG